MRLLASLVIALAFLSFAIYGEETPQNPKKDTSKNFVFLGIFYGDNAVERLKSVPLLSLLKVTNITSDTIAIYEPYLFVGRIANNVISSFRKAKQMFKEDAEKFCEKWKFGLIENFSLQVIPIETSHALLIFKGNIVCLDF